ncbi:MAG: hypothetical protein F4029_18080 [Gammaproteobacteria bacterium]|nr:hypothetical protein [Gammaproteobacteria bacterium]MYF27601.1 hypothetical protein [Gammaproteobacteria bacterium]MYK48126.1 hypothetical protein [Gammaproteobacteria bacterium]
MALRESVQANNREGDLDVVTGRRDGDAGVPHGAFLIDLANAVAGWHWDEAGALRQRGIELIGPDATRDAILVAAGFNGITRVADAIGIRLDTRTANASAGLRAKIGIDAFAPAEKWTA